MAKEAHHSRITTSYSLIGREISLRDTTPKLQIGRYTGPSDCRGGGGSRWFVRSYFVYEKTLVESHSDAKPVLFTEHSHKVHQDSMLLASAWVQPSLHHRTSLSSPLLRLLRLLHNEQSTTLPAETQSLTTHMSALTLASAIVRFHLH